MKEKINILMFSLTLVAFTIFCAFSLNQNYWLNWLGILIYLYAICTWHWRKGDSIFSLYTIFFTLFLLFSYGQCIMWAFGIGTDRGIGTTVVAYGTGIIPSESDMIMVKWYSCISMFVFHIGALLFTRKTTLRKVSWYESGDADADRKFLFKIGCIISIIVVPIVFVSKLLEVRIALVHGY
ncbi:TPA: oligosaccharide repeat unit polymerase, partial [Enterococcus faecium]